MAATTKPSIHERMVAILTGLPAIRKDSVNQGLKFNFRSVDAILNELNPLLEKHGVFIAPRVLDVRTEPMTKGRCAIVTVEYRFVAEDGSEVVTVSAGEGHDFGDKSVSKALTMAFKTCLGQVFAIATEDDPDGDVVQPPEPKAPPKPRPTPAPVEGTPKWQTTLALVKRECDTDEKLAAFREWLEAASLPNDFARMTDDQLNTVLAHVDPL